MQRNNPSIAMTSAATLRLPLTDWFVPLEFAPNPLRQFSSALAARGCPVRRDGDELVHGDDTLEARLALEENRGRLAVQLTVAIPENLLAAGASNLLDEMALEGLPVVSMGFGRGSATWEFRWSRYTGSTWREHAQRVLAILDRLRAAIR